MQTRVIRYIYGHCTPLRVTSHPIYPTWISPYANKQTDNKQTFTYIEHFTSGDVKSNLGLKEWHILGNLGIYTVHVDGCCVVLSC